MKTKILLNAPSSMAENFVSMFRPYANKIELHVITQTCLVEYYERNNDIVTKVHDISADYLRNAKSKDVTNFLIPDDIPLWEFVEYDRFIFRHPHDYIITVAKHHSWYLNKILLTEQYHFIIGEVAGLQHSLLQWFAKLHNIPFVWPMLSFWPDRFFMVAGGALALQNSISKMYCNNNDERASFFAKAESYLISMTAQTPMMEHVADHVNQNSFKFKKVISFVSTVPRKLNKLIRSFFSPPTMYLELSIFNVIKYIYIRRIYNSIFCRNLFAMQVPPDERNILYYLHYEPDLSTLVWSPYFKNQLEVITNIAFSLPNGHRLYVKEHPMSIGTRPVGYYKKILNIPNVRLLSHSIPTKSLLETTDLVITVTGSIGWEGLLYQKPVITLGNVFYNCFKGVIHLSDFEKLRETIKSQLSSMQTYTREELIEFIAFIMSTTYKGNYYRTITNPEDTDSSSIVAREILNFGNAAKEAL